MSTRFAALHAEGIERLQIFLDKEAEAMHLFLYLRDTAAALIAKIINLVVYPVAVLVKRIDVFALR